MADPRNVLRAANLRWTRAPGVPDAFGGLDAVFEGLPLTQLGAHLEELPPGRFTCPMHHHLHEEEHFLVLEGTLTVRELEEDAEVVRTFDLGPGELVAYPAGTALGHQFVNRGDAPARFLAVSDRVAQDVCVYPESGKVLLRGLREVGVLMGRPPGPPAADPAVDAAALMAEAREQAAQRPEVGVAAEGRPAHVVGPDRLPERALGQGDRQFFGAPLSRHAGAQTVFVNRDRLPPGHTSSDLHAHAGDEELLLVLAGQPTLRQRRGARDPHGRPDFGAAVEERATLGPGDVVHWGAGDLVAHQLINASSDDAVLLVIGTSRPDDVILFPDRGELFLPALWQVGPLVRVGYWDGEG